MNWRLYRAFKITFMKNTGQLLAIMAIMAATLLMSSCKKDKVQEPIDNNLKDYNELYQSFKKEQVSEIVKVTDKTGKNSLTMEIFAKDVGTLKQYLRAHDFVLNTSSDLLNGENVAISFDEDITEPTAESDQAISIFDIACDLEEGVESYSVEFNTNKTLRWNAQTNHYGLPWDHHMLVCIKSVGSSTPGPGIDWFTQHRWYSGWSYRGSNIFWNWGCYEYYHGMYRIRTRVNYTAYSGWGYEVHRKKWSGNSWIKIYSS